jgi:hypothetical protein
MANQYKKQSNQNDHSAPTEPKDEKPTQPAPMQKTAERIAKESNMW